MELTPENTKELKTHTVQEAIEALETILKENQILENKTFVSQLNEQIETTYQQKYREKLNKFLEENPEATETDFEWRCENRAKFEELLSTYKKEKSRLISDRKKQEEANYHKKKQLIEDLKLLVDETLDFPSALKQVFEIKDQWRKTGLAPLKQRNILWNDYQFHLERFFDQLHLDKEIRDKEFQQNLTLKKDLIAQAEKLLEKENIQEAFVQLQGLHRIWKEEIGPIAKEYRQELWEQFSAITSEIHKRKDAHREELKKQEEENFQLKNEVLNQIKEVNKLTFKTHKEWQYAMQTIEKLRLSFEQIGRVPKNKKNEQWQSFKEELRVFNHAKNEFYKLQKKKQQEVLEIRFKMIEKAEELKDSTDFETTTPLLKKLQDDWKNAGPIPRKKADELWQRFKDACNHYFDRLRKHIDERDSELITNFEKKKELLGEIEKSKETGDYPTDLKGIRELIDQWKSIGKVPKNKKSIEKEFYEQLDFLFDQLDVSKKESKLLAFNEEIERMCEENDEEGLIKKNYFIRKKIEEINTELLQLKNNIGFFSNASTDNPLLKEVNKTISKKEDEKSIWKEKLNLLKTKMNA